MATPWLRMLVRLDVCAMVVLLGASLGAAAQVETPEQRFADIRRTSLQQTELHIGIRDVPVKLVLLTCDAECHAANVIKVSDVGDICWRRPLVGALASGSVFGSTSAFAVKQPRRDQVFRSARGLVRAEPTVDFVPLPRRLLLAYRGGDGWIEQIFDRANLSPAVQSLVRELAGDRYLDFGPFVPRIRIDARYRPKHTPDQTTFAASDDGQLLASVQDRQVILLDSDLQELRSVELPVSLAYAVPFELSGRAAFSPDGKWLGVAVRDNRIIVLDTSDWSVAADIPLRNDRFGVRRLLFTRNSEAMVVFSDPCRCFHAGRWTPFDDCLNAEVVDFCESPRGDLALLLLTDGSLRLTGPMRSRMAGEQAGVAQGILLAEGCQRCVSAFSPDESLVATVTVSAAASATQPNSLQRDLKVWQVKDGAVVAGLLAFGLPIRDGAVLEWLSDSVHLAGVIQPNGRHQMIRSNSLHIWNVHDGRHVAELVGAHRPVGLASRGQQLFVADLNGQVCRWDLDRHRDVWRPVESGGSQ